MFYVIRSHSKQAYIGPKGLREFQLTKSLKEASKFCSTQQAMDSLRAGDPFGIWHSVDIQVVPLTQAELVGDYPEVEAIAWVG